MIRQITIIIAIGAMAGVWWHGNYHGRNAERLIWEQERAEAISYARQKERSIQEKINASLQKQYSDLADINTQLADDLERLRNRPGRVRTVIQPPINCPTQHGERLSIGRAEDITRLGADCAKERAAKIACYSALDALK